MGEMAADFSLFPQKNPGDKMLVCCSTGLCPSGYFGSLNETY